jgi:ppGpp synthetase/RelA/SpoT-type nucleotidyltranferase
VSADIRRLADTAQAEFSLYFRVASTVQAALQTALREAGLRGEVTARAKDVDQIVKKAIRKRYADPLEEIKDRAGARITLTYEYQVEEAIALVRALLRVEDEEDKHHTLAANELGYLGYHLDCRLPADVVGDDRDLEDLRCEIQIHTRMQSVWAEVSHELVYKARPAPPASIMRRILRLQPFVELFDEEVTRARQEILDLPSQNEARALQDVDRHFYRLAGVEFDEELSLQILTNILTLYGGEGHEAFSRVIASFVERNEQKLAQLYETYRAAAADHPLLYQPESILVFERLEADEFALADSWQQDFPLPLLEDLSVLWGKPLASMV